jgi:oxygen-independent coproporphyrinogen-3 oxidase
LAVPERSLSLYVHVPFCTDKCLYCDFFSVPRDTVTPTTMQRVVTETISHARCLVGSAGSDARLETLFIGGGTPSCLPPPERRRLLDAFTDLRPSEWTVESNPETLDEGFLDDCAAAGVTRLSVGIQSLSTAHLKTLRRRATREHALAAIRLLKARWRGQLNLDFITGIPGQAVAEVREDLAVLGELWPDHVSLYQLTVEPGTPLEVMVDEGSLRLNRGEQDEELWLAGRDELLRQGFQQYEVSNFCRPQKECGHNLRYWRIQPYAGAGPGSVSTLPAAWAARAAGRPELAQGETAVVRLTAPKDIPAFLRGQDGFWGSETELVSPSDFLLENVMMGLRLSRGIEESMLVSRFGHAFTELFPGVWEDWVSRGLAVPPNGTLMLTDAGLLLLDRLLGELFERREKSSPESLQLHWPP